ncbi:MAG: hypothetical protein EBR73_12880, partial [Rhodobacteraceae bacterium]|nr:hypothetical protein [Paracoccaceae bacterium]
TDYIEQVAAQGWARVDVAPGEWVAVVPNDAHTAFGGTLWRRAEDGNDYAEGVTEGHPVSAALDYEAAARAIAVMIKREVGA